MLQGLENIAAISLALGYKNKATEGFEALKRKKTSAGSVKLTVAVSGKEMSAHSSHAQWKTLCCVKSLATVLLTRWTVQFR